MEQGDAHASLLPSPFPSDSITTPLKAQQTAVSVHLKQADHWRGAPVKTVPPRTCTTRTVGTAGPQCGAAVLGRKHLNSKPRWLVSPPLSNCCCWEEQLTMRPGSDHKVEGYF